MTTNHPAPAEPATPIDLDALLSPAGPYETGPDAAMADGAQLVRDQHGNPTWWAPMHGCDSLDGLLDQIRSRILPHLRPPANHFPGATKMVAPPAEGEVIDLAGCVQAWAARLDEGTPEERLLGRVAYVLRQRQAPPHDGEVDALIKILSRIAGMLDFMPDGPPDGLVIHRAIELLRQLTPLAEGEAGGLVADLEVAAASYFNRGFVTDARRCRRAADLLQQQAAELAECREALRRVRLEQRIPGGGW